MAFRKPDQLTLKNIASFSQGSRIPHGVSEQFTPNKKIPDMLALRNFGDLFSIFHPLPFDISPLSILPVCGVDTTSLLKNRAGTLQSRRSSQSPHFPRLLKRPPILGLDFSEPEVQPPGTPNSVLGKANNSLFNSVRETGKFIWIGMPQEIYLLTLPVHRE
jgi:hypothetical protein